MCSAGRPAQHRRCVDRVLAALLLLVSTGLLSSCGGPAAIAFFEEIAWYAQGVPDEELRSALSAEAASVGMRLEVIVSSTTQPRVALGEALAARPASMAVVVPLVSLEVDQLAVAHPDVHFVAIGATSAPAPNVTAVAFDSDEAFERAGRVMGLYVLARNEARVAVVERRPVAVAGVEQVVAGIQQVAGTDVLLRRELQAGADRVRLRRLIEGVVRDGATVVFLDVGNLAAVGLATIEDQGVLAVVRNWGRRPGYEGTLLLTVEEDLSEAIRAGLEQATAGGRPSPGDAPLSVTGRVVWRLDEPPPAAAATLLDPLWGAHPGSSDDR